MPFLPLVVLNRAAGTISSMNREQATVLTRPSQTKIVATIGPACASLERLIELIRAGVDVFRINTAHGNAAEHRRRLELVREASRAAGLPVAVLVELHGPKIRLGPLPNDKLELVAGSLVRFLRPGATAPPGAPALSSSYDRLVDELNRGDRIVLADGLVSLSVESLEPQWANCRVVQGGLVRSNQGVTLPGVKLAVPALGPADRDRAEWAAAAGAEFVGLSFVRSPEDVDELRRLIKSVGASTHIVAKIEKSEAVENIEQIVRAADAVMVARGDLGVEIDIASVPVVQKQIIATCRRYCKPVIVATQMLESMHHSLLPTRAEATDVANAILDGADACMLSGETAIGDYPLESVQMMHRIALATERIGRWPVHRPAPGRLEGVNEVTPATCYAAGQLAEQLGAKLLLVCTETGTTARVLAQQRWLTPIVAASPRQATLRTLCLCWGVIPLQDAPAGSQEALLEYVVGYGRAAGLIEPGDRLVFIGRLPPSPSRHNMVVVHQVN